MYDIAARNCPNRPSVQILYNWVQKYLIYFWQKDDRLFKFCLFCCGSSLRDRRSVLNKLKKEMKSISALQDGVSFRCY